MKNKLEFIQKSMNDKFFDEIGESNSEYRIIIPSNQNIGNNILREVLINSINIKVGDNIEIRNFTYIIQGIIRYKFHSNLILTKEIKNKE